MKIHLHKFSKILGTILWKKINKKFTGFLIACIINFWESWTNKVSVIRWKEARRYLKHSHHPRAFAFEIFTRRFELRSLERKSSLYSSFKIFIHYAPIFQPTTLKRFKNVFPSFCLFSDNQCNHVLLFLYCYKILFKNNIL